MTRRLLACGILAASLVASSAQACTRATIVHASKNGDYLEVSNGLIFTVPKRPPDFYKRWWIEGAHVLICDVFFDNGGLSTVTPQTIMIPFNDPEEEITVQRLPPQE